MHVKYSCSHSDGSLHCHFCVTGRLQTAIFLCFLQNSFPGYVASWVFPMITGSQTVPVITFIKFSFWKTNKKKNHCLDMFFFISQNIYCFKMTSNYSNDIFYFVKYVDLRTMRMVLNSLTLFSIFVLSYWNLAVYLNWMTDVCVFCAYVCVCECVLVSMCMSDWDDGLYCQLNSPSVTGQERQSPTFVKEEKVTACNYLIQCISSFLLYRTTVPLQGTFANIFSPDILCM